jgi:hypothetical protein
VEQRVQVGWGNVALEPGLAVAGYDISGSVLSGKVRSAATSPREPTAEPHTQGEPVAGVEFVLYSAEVVPEEVACAAGGEALRGMPAGEAGERALCVARSDARGRFAFAGVDCGAYRLVPVYHDARTTFDLVPPVLPLRIERASLALQEPFRVLGFSVTGRVLDHLGRPLPDVSLSLGTVRPPLPSLISRDSSDRPRSQTNKYSPRPTRRGTRRPACAIVSTCVRPCVC